MCSKSLLRNLADVCLLFRQPEGSSCVHTPAHHALLHIYKGGVEAADGRHHYRLRAGETLWMPKAHCVSLRAVGAARDETRCALLYLEAGLLRQLYFAMAHPSAAAAPLPRGMLRLAPRADLAGLFASLLPYETTDYDPEQRWLRLKMVEAVYALLRADEGFDAQLFGFAYGERTDVVDIIESPLPRPVEWHSEKFLRVELAGKAN